MNFSYATLATLQDVNGKNHINGIENFFSKRVRKQITVKRKRATICVATAY